MAITAQRVTAGAAAVALNAASPTAGMTLVIKNTSANAASLGPSTVTGVTGLELAAGATTTVILHAGDVLYAIRSGASDATLAVLRS